MKKVRKSVLKDFIILDDGTEFLYSNFISTIHKILEISKNDIIENYSLRDYEIEYSEVIKYLVKKDYVKKYLGSKQEILYCVKNKKKLQELLNKIENLSIETSKNNTISTNFIKKSEIIDFLMNNYDTNWTFNDLLEGINKLTTY